jgi:DNA polymerase-3 subunit delta
LKINANQLTGHLQQALLPCYLVSGDEPLLVQEAVDQLRAAARSQGFTERELHVSGPGFDWSMLMTGGANLSLFAEKRIIELRLPTGKPGKEGSAAIVDLVAAANEDTLILVIAPKLDRSTQSAAWVKAIDKVGGFLQVWPVSERDLPGWIAKRMRDAGLRPEKEAVHMIADRVEGNLLAAQQEIEKLCLLHGDGEVTAEDVANAVVDSSRYDVYKLTDAAVAGNARRALKILGGLRNEGVEPVIVAWALTRELRVLAGIRAGQDRGVDLGTAMRKSGVWQNRQGLIRACIGRHDTAGLYRLLQKAGQTDAAAKGQLAGDPWQLAMETVLGLASSGGSA